ncbi:uncharacterized protein isoform X2 [Rhodnius prolixus]|uniref:uncharacterized protein isoform X2 n=1 Tax=Rhodnius prolixus TaxID=13249 RepID=UPI003D189934
MMWDDNWKPDYANASRPGLISDGTASRIYEVSTMKDEFRIPRIDEIPRGRRKQLLRKFLWQEFANKYIEELEKPPKIEIEPPISHYMENYSCGGFKVTDNLLERLTPELAPPFLTDCRFIVIISARNINNI